MRGHRAYCPRERTLLVAITRLGMKNDRKSSMADGVEGRRRIGKRGGWLSISHRHCWLKGVKNRREEGRGVMNRYN